MVKRIAALLALALLAAPGPSQAAPFVSDKLGFSADFPSVPEVGEPEGSEQDAKGKFISTLTTVASKKQGAYMAAVFEDVFDVATKLDVTQSLALERDNFLKGMSGTVVEAHEATLSGHRAGYFAYATTGHAAQGRGVVIIVESDKPKVYFAVVMYTPQASADERAQLDAFFASFKLIGP
jgi:hypothetical protein